MKLKLKDMASIYLSTKCVKKDSEDLSDLFFSAIRRSSTDKFINTLVEKIKNKHPKYSHALKDPDVIREEFEILQNPQLHAEFMKSADRMMNAIEMRAGSYQKLINFHELFNEMYSEISLDFQTKDEYPTVIPKEKATSPSTEPLQLHYPFPHDFFQILQQTDESPEGKALTQLVKAVLTCFWPTKKKESKPSPFFMQSDDESENEGKETNEDLYQNYEMFSSDEEEEEDSSKQEENEISKTDSDNSDIDLESYLFEPD
ncbi:ubiquitin family protein [Histomonas meleagridis]|uniref:ubiquitin family protein n=1 Tax=Histomonas meleagridis TaxID=135588 RepID=UPI00355AB149|nr:ubiquitin family protein [Histomonas meleagridis]KAH0797751.1 ubiquitin family protein [Histomonas meleagridis]